MSELCQVLIHLLNLPAICSDQEPLYGRNSLHRCHKSVVKSFSTVHRTDMPAGRHELFNASGLCCPNLLDDKLANCKRWLESYHHLQLGMFIQTSAETHVQAQECQACVLQVRCGPGSNLSGLRYN